MILKAGTYRFTNTNVYSSFAQNDTITLIGELNHVEIEPLTINGYTAVHLSCFAWDNRDEGTENTLLSLIAGFDIGGNIMYLPYDLLTEEDIAIVLNTEFTISTDQAVDDSYGEYFIANTNYNEVNATPLAEILYNGETIAQLGAGDKATIPCSQYEMSKDLVFKVNEVESGETDIPYAEGVKF